MVCRFFVVSDRLLFSIPVVLFVPVKLADLLHLIVRQFKTKQIEVFPDMIGIARAGDHDDASLQIPAEDDLGGRYSVSFRYCTNDLILNGTTSCSW